MKNKIWKKGLVIEILILFMSASVVPVISSNIENAINIKDDLTNMETVKMSNTFVSEYQEGWPQTILSDPYYWGGIVSPVVDDLDNDGAMELILTQQADPVKLYVFCHNGSLKFPIIEISGYISPRSFTSVADIDNDGFKEIIVDVQSKIAIYSSDGALKDLWELPYQASEGGIYRAPVLADLNNDDTLEVIYGGWDIDGSRLVVLDNEGMTLTGFPILLENIQFSEVNMPAVGNFDEDDDLEIVVISHENNQPTKLSNIRVFNYDSSLLWSQQIDVIVSQPASIGDVNNDGYDEVIFTSTKGVHILDRFGNYMVNNVLGADDVASYVALADLDGNNNLEVIFGFLTTIYAMNYEGDILWSYDTGYLTHYPPIVEDITGDNIPDIVVTSDYEVFAWDSQGILIDGFPKDIEINAYGACSVADIDNDQDVELIASADWKWIKYHGKDYNEGYIYIWDLSGVYNSSTVEWPMFHHDQQHTGRYKKDIEDNLPPDTPIITGPINGKVGTSYDYTFNATDSDSDPVMYIIDWGDDNTEWTEYGDSGVEFILKHTWEASGKYTIKAKAKDIHDAESEWAEFIVTMPRNKIFYSSFQQFLQSHPNLFPLLQKLLLRLGL